MDNNLTHEVVEKTMTYHLAAGFKVLVDFKNKSVTTSLNENVIDKQTMEQMGTLTQFDAYLAVVDGIAETMKGKTL